jgi:hypothetical protein
MRPGAGGGLGAGDHGSSTGLVGELTAAGAGNGFDGDIGDIDIEEIRSWGSSFDRLMRNPVGRKLFREFLVSEYSDENIAFWLACEQLKRENNPEKIEEKARFIYEDYISIISPKEVSIPRFSLRFLTDSCPNFVHFSIRLWLLIIHVNVFLIKILKLKIK